MIEYCKNILIKNDNGTIYRILELTERVLVIDCNKRTMPVWKKHSELIDFEEFTPELKELSVSSRQETEATRRYSLIAPIVPFIANEKLRAEMISSVAERGNVTEQTIRKYLCAFLAEQDIRALAPKERDVRELTEDEKNIRKSLNKWYYSTKKRTLKTCYTLMLEKYYCDADGKLVENFWSDKML